MTYNEVFPHRCRYAKKMASINVLHDNDLGLILMIIFFFIEKFFREFYMLKENYSLNVCSNYIIEYIFSQCFYHV